MTLREFAIKNQLNADELLEILVFEKFPITSIDDEIDIRITNYLSDYSSKKNKVSKKSKFIGNKKSNKFLNKKNKNEEKNIFIPKLFLEKTSISKCSKDSGKSVSEIISFFLKNKKLYSINTILSIDEIKELAEYFSINPIEIENEIKIDEKQKNIFIENLNEKSKNNNLIERSPIVVVVGHVDHGKTTLLDYIRKKNVAKSEKGGITQHLGAYEIKNKDKNITFIDTPGHAAFTSLRSRGVYVADIAILVVAADDGVMQQTIESIKMLKNMGSSIILAITKSDKLNILSDEKIFQQLADNDILVEAWGGNIPHVKISGLKGDGIDELLELINLTSELMDLKTDPTTNGFGFILESKIVKGFGPTATVLLKNGKLKIGDYFYVNDISGKVTNIIDTFGNSLKEVGASVPFLLSGFESLSSAGEILRVADLKTVKKETEENKLRKLNEKNNNTLKITNLEKAKIFNLIIKADVYSSLQAIQQAINNIADKYFYYPLIISSGVGNITESDINTAINSNAIIYGFNVKKESGLDDLIEQFSVKIENFDVIYHLLEDLQSKIEKQKEPQKIQKKIGDLLILKIFYIKNVGTVVGFRVTNGIVKVGTMINIFRDKEKIGEGKVTSLQKDRQYVKELSKGHEGAISVDGFNDWKEEDKVEVYIEIYE